MAAFFEKITKNRPTAGALPPDPHRLRKLGAPAPRSPSVIRLNYTGKFFLKLSQHVSKVKYLYFSTITLSPLPLQNSGLVPIGNDFRSSILRYFCPAESSSFENF